MFLLLHALTFPLLFSAVFFKSVLNQTPGTFSFLYIFTSLVIIRIKLVYKKKKYKVSQTFNTSKQCYTQRRIHTVHTPSIKQHLSEIFEITVRIGFTATCQTCFSSHTLFTITQRPPGMQSMQHAL